jgi:hypothetical protein
MKPLNRRAISDLEDVAGKIESFPVGYFADENARGLYLLEFWKLANRFVAGVRVLSDELLISMVCDLDIEPCEPREAFVLHAKLLGAITVLRSHLEATAGASVQLKPFVDPKIIDALRDAELPKLDLSKLVRMCEELNTCYSHENYLACALLIRAAMNHVPPVFGFPTFKEVASNAGRSVKAALQLLEDDARVVADLHNHATMRSREPLPTLGQIEPFRASFEILLHEILARATNKGA